jgi:hypothetical protein
MGPDQQTAVRYAFYKDGQWSDYESLWPESHPGEHPNVSITNGNQLHVVWNDYRNGEVVYTNRHLDSTWIPASEFLELEPVRPSEVQNSLNSQLDVNEPSKTVTRESLRTFETSQPEKSFDTNLIILFGIIPVFLLVALVAVYNLRRT